MKHICSNTQFSLSLKSERVGLYSSCLNHVVCILMFHFRFWAQHHDNRLIHESPLLLNVLEAQRWWKLSHYVPKYFTLTLHLLCTISVQFFTIGIHTLSSDPSCFLLHRRDWESKQPFQRCRNPKRTIKLSFFSMLQSFYSACAIQLLN